MIAFWCDTEPSPSLICARKKCNLITRLQSLSEEHARVEVESFARKCVWIKPPTIKSEVWAAPRNNCFAKAKLASSYMHAYTVLISEPVSHITLFSCSRIRPFELHFL